MITMKILSFNRQGLSCKEIAAKLGNITPSAVYKRLYRRGVKVNAKRSLFDPSYFSNINTEKKAYWLGFSYADATILDTTFKGNTMMALRFGLAIKDISHLQNFLTDIKATNSICVCNKGKECRVSLQSIKLVQDMSKWGCTPRKSLTIEGIPNIPQKLIRHFIRGYFDGDGCVCTDKSGKNLRLNILGTLSFLSEIHYVLRQNDITFGRPHTNGNIYVIEGNGNQRAKKLYNYLYKRATRYLNRKKDKFDAVL